MENKNVPSIRFKGFFDDWEQRKLIDNAEKVLDYRGKSPTKFGMEWGNEGYLVLSALNVKNGYIDKSIEAKYGSPELFERWMGDNRLVKGDVLFTTEAPLGNVAQVPDNKGYILNQRAVAFKASKVTDNNFFAQLLRSPIIQNILNSNSSGGTAKGIGMKEFAKISAHVPKLEEQQKIGLFFKQLDETITLQERELELLKLTKKGFLQQLFPENNQLFPNIRFSNFQNEWEQRKLGEVLRSHPLRTYLAEPIYGGEYEVIQQGDNPIIGTANGKPFAEYYSVILFGDHTVSLFKPQKPFFVATDGVKIISADNFDGNYLFTTLERYKPESQGYKRHFTILKNIDFCFTENKNEQIKIGTFFKQIEETISLQERKLKNLKIVKSAFLQKMFI
ncbi:restriction endonuclease subunit S [Vagococcus fluvialis]|uniref:restriction endonuclease subunit S n=1 Tax=Vagococcus fluvialis TaxID=2738 RepID=UPI003B2169FF